MRQVPLKKLLFSEKLGRRVIVSCCRTPPTPFSQMSVRFLGLDQRYSLPSTLTGDWLSDYLGQERETQAVLFLRLWVKLLLYSAASWLPVLLGQS